MMVPINIVIQIVWLVQLVSFFNFSWSGIMYVYILDDFIWGWRKIFVGCLYNHSTLSFFFLTIWEDSMKNYNTFFLNNVDPYLVLCFLTICHGWFLIWIELLFGISIVCKLAWIFAFSSFVIAFTDNFQV